MATVQKSSIVIVTGNMNAGGPTATSQLSLVGLPGYYGIISVYTDIPAGVIRFTNGTTVGINSALPAGSIVYVPQGTNVTSENGTLQAGSFGFVIYNNS